MENGDFYFGKYLNTTWRGFYWVIFGWDPNCKI